MFSLKEKIITILGFVGQKVLCPNYSTLLLYSSKTAVMNGHSCFPIEIDLWKH